MVLNIDILAALPLALSLYPKGVLNLALPLDHSLYELSCELALIGPSICSLSADFIIVKLSLVRLAVLENHLSKAVSFRVNKVSLVEVAIRPSLLAVSVEHPLAKLPLVNLSIKSIKLSLATVHIVCPASFVDSFLGLKFHQYSLDFLVIFILPFVH